MVVVGVWGILVLAGELLGRLGMGAPPSCGFRRLTGHPCLTCGGTRSVISAVSGDFGAAFLWNPLVFLALVLLLGLTGVRLVAARGLVVSLDRRERGLAWAGVVILAALNWGYLLRMGC
jgi:hypothetical protein